jgi:hypothetical protein
MSEIYSPPASMRLDLLRNGQLIMVQTVLIRLPIFLFWQKYGRGSIMEWIGHTSINFCLTPCMQVPRGKWHMINQNIHPASIWYGGGY